MQNQDQGPPPDFFTGRRKVPLMTQQRSREEKIQEPETIDAERLEDVLTDQGMSQDKIEEAFKEVSRIPRK